MRHRLARGGVQLIHSFLPLAQTYRMMLAAENSLRPILGSASSDYKISPLFARSKSHDTTAG